MEKILSSKDHAIRNAKVLGYLYPCSVLSKCYTYEDCNECKLGMHQSKKDGNYYNTAYMSDSDITTAVDKVLEETTLLIALG